jgi:autotransporter-associated beta strand protein
MSFKLAARFGLTHLSIVALLACGSAAKAQTTVYFDDFSGGGAALNGTTPDTSLGGAAWAAGAAILDNGSIGAATFTAVLPFQPQPNFIYSLSADINTNSATAGNNNWTGIGFTQVQQPNLAARWLETGQPALWAMSRSNTAALPDQSFLGFAGGTQTFGGEPGPGISVDRIVIGLDTTGLDWVWTVDFGGDGVDRTVNVATIPNINFVGLTNAAANTGGSTVDNFQLTQLEVPLNEWNIDGGGVFGEAANWTMGLPAPGSIVLFGDILTEPNAPAVITLNTATSLGQIRFADAQRYSIQGSAALTLTGDATVATIQGNHEIGARITGSSGLRKAGAGELLLTNGTNNYTGDTTVSTGVLEVNNLGAINQASGLVNVATGATFRLGGDGAGNGASGALTEEVAGAGQLRLHNTLTTETITAGTANPNFTGAVSIGGGTLRVTNGAALGTADGTAATATLVGGGTETGTLELTGITVTGELLRLPGRQPANLDPHVISSGTNTWTGPVAGEVGGNQFTIESQSGLLTLSGNITMPDNANDAGRNLNLTGAGDGRISGRIIDRTVMTGDGAENININVVKRGTGTWTIGAGNTTRDDFHQGRTIVEQGTLAVQGNGADGELWSRTIEVRSGTVFDISSFTSYSLQLLEDPDMSFPAVTGDEVGQELTGSGTVNLGAGKTLAGFDDSVISPGDNGVGALNIAGNFSYSTFGELATGGWNYELGGTTGAGDSDRLAVSGSATINAGDADDAINVDVSPVDGTLASGAYSLVQAASVAGSAAPSNYVMKVRDSQGNDITAGARQTFNVSHAATSVNLNVTGASADLQWAGTSGNAWDVATTGNWTGAGGPQFRQLDHVTFGNVANKNVTVNTNVAPGSVTFNGGAGSTYAVSGTGGMTGFGPVNVNTGTVQLNNAGNAYRGATTIASGARLEMASASTGSMMVNGTLSVSGNVTSTLIDDFNDGNLSEYTVWTTLDQVGAPGTTVGPPDDVVYSNTGSAITVNGAQNGNPAAEQALAIRPTTLAVGETLVVDANLNTNHGTFATVGIALADSSLQADVPPGPANADIRRGYLITGMRLGEANDGQNTQSVPAAGGTVPSTGPGNIGVVTNLWITRTGANSYTMGHSKDGMLTRVQTDSRNETQVDWLPDSVGFYADVRGALTPNAGTMDNLRIAPNNNVLAINGDFTLAPTGVLELDLGQDASDSLNITGAATLDGTISVNLAGGFTPNEGAQYTILSAAGGITDLGVTYNLPTNFSAAVVDMTSLVLTFAATLGGDFNGDGTVDAADYVVWRKTDGSQEGYDEWRTNFGATAGAGSTSAADAAAVPEPGAFVLLALSGVLVALVARSRRGSLVACA